VTNQHDNPIYYAHSPLGMRPSDMEYGPMRYVRETDYHVAQRKIAELEAALTSIANNSCCDKCQEAALIARQALKGEGNE